MTRFNMSNTTFNWTLDKYGKADFIIKQNDETFSIKIESNYDAHKLADVLENMDADMDENLNDDEDETDE